MERLRMRTAPDRRAVLDRTDHPLRLVIPILALVVLTSACGGDGPVSADPDPVREPSFTFLPAPGGSGGAAYSVGVDGVTVGWARDAAGRSLPVRWSSEGAVEVLSPASFTYGYATGVSNDGTHVTGIIESEQGSLHAFRWSTATGFDDLGAFGGSEAFTFRISDDGSTIAGASRGAGVSWEAVRWTTAGGLEVLGTLGGTQAFGYGTSANGSIVVGTSSVEPGELLSRGFRWTSASGMVELASATEGGATAAEAISPDGAYIVGYGEVPGGEHRALVWTGTAGVTALASAGATYLRPRPASVSADGSVIVGSDGPSVSFTDRRAVRWRLTGEAEDLNEVYAALIPAGWVLRTAWGVSADGRFIVGEAQAGEGTRPYRIDTTGGD